MIDFRCTTSTRAVSTVLSIVLFISACEKDEPSSPGPVPDGLTNNGWTRKSGSGEFFRLGSGPTDLYGIVTEIEGGGLVPATSYTATFLSSSDMGNTWTSAPLMAGGIGAEEFILFGSPRFVDDQVGFYSVSHGSIWNPVTTTYRCANGGESWSPMSGGPGSGFIRVGLTSRLFRYGGSQTYVSQNMGSTWSAASPALGGLNDIVFTDDLHGFATGNSGILSSVDGGSTWQTMSAQEFQQISHQDPLKGIATRGYPTASGELMRTTDGWASSELVQTPPELGGPGSILLDGTGRLYASQAERLYVSADLGSSWSLDLEMTSGHDIQWIRRVGDHLVVATTSSSWARKFAPL